MTHPPSTHSILYGVDRATLQQWLTEAQQAYKDLQTGGKPVTVSYDGKSVTYTAATASALEGWIKLLMHQLGLGRGRKALRPYFR